MKKLHEPQGWARSWGLVGAVLLLATGCRGAPETPTPEPVVARWHDVEVPAGVFAEAYRAYATSAPGPDTPEARRAFALDLLMQRVIAARHGDGFEGDVRAARRRALAAALRQAYLAHITDAVPGPTEGEVREAFRRTQTRLDLQQIYAATRAEADSLYALLQAGADFDALAAASMRRYGISNPEAAGRMGWVGWNDMDLAPEAAAFALSPGEVSAPVASLRGWHIFRVLNRQEQARADASAYQSAREQLGQVLHQRRRAEHAARHVQSLLARHTLATDPAALDALARRLAPVWAQTPALAGPDYLRDALAALPPEALDLERPVGYLDGAPITTRRFLDDLPGLPRAALGPNLRPALELAVRDRLLARAAEAARLDTAAAVRRAVAEAEVTARYQGALRAAADTLDREAARRRLHARYRDRYFTDTTFTTLRLAHFADSTSAWAALRAYRSGAAWSELLGTAERIDTLTTEVTQLGPVALATLPAPDSAGRAVPVGPFRIGATWRVLDVLDRRATYRPYASFEERMDELLVRHFREVLHDVLLPPGFDPDAAVVYPDRLRDALPRYSE